MLLTLIALLVPWYFINSTRTDLNGDVCDIKQEQATDWQVVSGSCLNNTDPVSQPWNEDGCQFNFCRNKFAIFKVSQGLLAFSFVMAFISLVVYAVGAWGPKNSFYIHETGAIVFCWGVCAALPLVLAIFLFGIGITFAVHQDQVDYLVRTGTSNATTANTPCIIDTSCTSFAGETTVINPCSKHPFGCFADPDDGVRTRSIHYEYGAGAGYIIAIISAIIAAIVVIPFMAVLGLRPRPSNRDEEKLAMLSSTAPPRQTNAASPRPAPVAKAPPSTSSEPVSSSVSSSKSKSASVSKSASASASGSKSASASGTS